MALDRVRAKRPKSKMYSTVAEAIREESKRIGKR